MKDYFSEKSENYAQFRPGYPAELFLFFKNSLSNRQTAWDCGTGNGQVAGELANFFRQVYATDISLSQLANAVQKPNIHYTKQAAEKTIFPDAHFDLVTVGQAAHWFNFSSFYSEVNRVLKKDGKIAIFGYGLFKSSAPTNELIDKFYNSIIGPFWDKERKYLEEEYKTIPFPFQEISTPGFYIKQRWAIERLMGYLNTWSAVKKYEREKGENPVDLIREDLYKTFGEIGEVTFPVFLRFGLKKERT